MSQVKDQSISELSLEIVLRVKLGACTLEAAKMFNHYIRVHDISEGEASIHFYDADTAYRFGRMEMLMEQHLKPAK